MTIAVQVVPYGGVTYTYTVPSNVTSIFWELYGAPGAASYAATATRGGTSGYPADRGVYAYASKYDKTTMANGQNTKGVVGYVSGNLPVTPGDTYYLTPGGAGGVANYASSAKSSTTNYGPGGFNGGGNGGYCKGISGQPYGPGSGGGGASDIRHGGQALANRIAVAGGGGGGGGGVRDNNTQIANTARPTSPTPPYNNDTIPNSGNNNGPAYGPSAGPTYGGAGGGPTGQIGGNASSTSTDTAAGTGGRGGTQTAAGTGGIAVSPASGNGLAGALGVGGGGGNVSSAELSAHNTPAAGGGGGGGYYGGGGGCDCSFHGGSFSGAGGGGGSNFVGSLSSPLSVQGVLPGGDGINGFIRATYLQPPDAPQVLSPADGSYVGASLPLEVDWVFSSPLGATYEAQTGFDIEYSSNGGVSWITSSNPSSTADNFTFPGGTFTSGTTYLIQVRVYDSSGDVGPWTQFTIHSVALPNAPTITAPVTGAGIASTPFNVTWTVDSGAVETMYRVQVVDNAGAVIVDSGELYSTRVNLCTNPSFETSTAGWLFGGFASIATSTTFKKLGANSLKISWGVNDPVSASAFFLLTTVPGQTYTVSYWYTVGNLSVDPAMEVIVLASDANSQIGSGAAVIPGTAGTFVQGSCTFVAHDGASYITFANASATTAPSVGYLDEVLIEEGSTVNTYFDGSNTNGNPGTATWQGTANLSASQLTIANILTYSASWPLQSQPITVSVTYATVADSGIYSPAGTSHPIVNLNPPSNPPTVTLSTNPDTGSIWVNVTAPTGTQTFPIAYIDLYRTNVTDGEAEELIATGISMAASPGANYVDYTPATETVYTYRVRCYSAAGGFVDVT